MSIMLKCFKVGCIIGAELIFVGQSIETFSSEIKSEGNNNNNKIKF